MQNLCSMFLMFNNHLRNVYKINIFTEIHPYSKKKKINLTGLYIKIVLIKIS